MKKQLCGKYKIKRIFSMYMLSSVYCMYTVAIYIYMIYSCKLSIEKRKINFRKLKYHYKISISIINFINIKFIINLLCNH